MQTSILLFVVAGCLSATSFSYAAMIHDPALRSKLGQTFAPEIHQDQEELYGIASFAYFLRQSTLRAVVRRCPGLPKGYPTVSLGPGALIVAPPNQGRLTWKQASCTRRFALYATRRQKIEGISYEAAPNRLYLRLRDRKATTYLKAKHKLAITPTIAFHAYETQTLTCIKRNVFRLCQQHKILRHYVIQYFVPLMFNEACNEHEGEQEGMLMLVDATAFDRARHALDQYKAIRKVGFYGHYNTKLYPPSQVAFVDMTHPIAYMGKGGHALYPQAGSQNLLHSFARELRKPMVRACRKRGRYARLTEHHRGGGTKYKTWQPPTGALATKYTAATYLPVATPSEQALIASQPGLTDACLMAREKRGVRLCDVRPNQHNDPCCLRGNHMGYVPWVQFTGRWGQQERFASSMASAAAAQMGRLLRRWPLARSMGNSGPFGPQWIHASTWNWLVPSRKPAATSPLWR